MMDLDNAIKHAEEVAEEHERHLKVYENMDEDRPLFREEENECKDCAEEHRQLARWLKELKQLREQKPCEDAISRRAVIEYIKASDAELGHSSEKEIVVEDIKCIATVKFSKEEVKWLKELRAYRKIYHKEHVDDCLRAEMEGGVCKGCHYNDGEVHAECVVCDKAEMEGEE